MTRYENIWTFHTARCVITLDVTPDDDLDLSFDDDGTVAENLNSGLWCAFVARVRVLIDGEEAGCDYLGGCIYENPSDFMDHRGINSTGCGSYFTDMVRSAITEARAWCAIPKPQMRAA